jgi:hypothetical protein
MITSAKSKRGGFLNVAPHLNPLPRGERRKELLPHSREMNLGAISYNK